MHKTTRRIHYILGAAATLALTQCASVQEIEAPVLAPATFEVFATPVDTKTVNDGMSTLWESGDRFSLFHAPAGTAKYTADGAFAVDEPATGHARGNVSGTLEGSYDWFLVYPHAASATTPSAVPVLIGAAADGVQTQNGASSGAHLAGESIPVAGRASGIAGTEVPVLHSAPIVSVIAVKVTNPGAASATVTSVRFKAPDHAGGIVQDGQLAAPETADLRMAAQLADEQEIVAHAPPDPVLPVGDIRESLAAQGAVHVTDFLRRRGLEIPAEQIRTLAAAVGFHVAHGEKGAVLRQQEVVHPVCPRGDEQKVRSVSDVQQMNFRGQGKEIVISAARIEDIRSSHVPAGHLKARRRQGREGGVQTVKEIQGLAVAGTPGAAVMPEGQFFENVDVVRLGIGFFCLDCLIFHPCPERGVQVHVRLQQILTVTGQAVQVTQVGHVQIHREGLLGFAETRIQTVKDRAGRFAPVFGFLVLLLPVCGKKQGAAVFPDQRAFLAGVGDTAFPAACEVQKAQIGPVHV